MTYLYIFCTPSTPATPHSPRHASTSPPATLWLLLTRAAHVAAYTAHERQPCVCVCVCVCVCMYVHMYISTHNYFYICVCVCIHTHHRTRTHTPPKNICVSLPSTNPPEDAAAGWPGTLSVDLTGVGSAPMFK